MATQVSEKEARDVAEQARESEWKLPSFCKELFMGTFRLDLIHPQPRLDRHDIEKGERFLEQLRSFLRSDVDPMQLERDAKIPDHVLDGLKEIGALGMKVPESYGGLGLSQVTYNQALTLAGAYHQSLSTFLSAHQSIGVPEPLRLAGSEAQKREWLPKVARDHVSAFLLTEPDVGSDPARLAATAEPTSDGSGYVLNGRKLWATNGAIADVVVVMAQVPKSEGRKGGDLLLHRSLRHRGRGRRAPQPVHGPARHRELGDPARRRLRTGREPDRQGGPGPQDRAVDIEHRPPRPHRACRSAGPTARAPRRTRARPSSPTWRRRRRSREVAQKISFIAGSAFGLEAMLDVASRLADDKQNDIRIEASIAKLYASEMGWRIVDDLMQIRGGRGYETAESLRARGEKPIPVEQALRDMRVNRIFEGSSEIMHLMIAREAVDQHLQVAGDILEPDVELKDKGKAAIAAGAFYGKWFPGLVAGKGQSPGSYNEFGELAKHLRFVERNSRKLARSIFYCMTRWQAALEKKQARLGRIVDIGAGLFAISSAVVYANTIASEQPERGEQASELADVFCKQARRRVDELFTALWFNDDEDNYEVAMGVLDGRYEWLEEGIVDPSDYGSLIAGQPEEVAEAAAI